MKTTFVALANLSGIACTSDTDHTIYRLAKEVPFAVAVNPLSPVPWEQVVNGFIRLGEPEKHKYFINYVRDFEKVLEKAALPKGAKGLSAEEATVAFMGYGEEDLFPCIVEAVVGINPDTHALCFTNTDVCQLDHQQMATIQVLGDLDSVSTILWGVPQRSESFFKKEYNKVVETHINRLRKKFNGTAYEQKIEEALERYNADRDISISIERCKSNSLDNVFIGVETFSIQDMVDATETLVDIEVRLDHLSKGLSAPLQSVREIAVITRTEGVTWVKHSLFAPR